MLCRRANSAGTGKRKSPRRRRPRPLLQHLPPRGRSQRPQTRLAPNGRTLAPVGLPQTSPGYRGSRGQDLTPEPGGLRIAVPRTLREREARQEPPVGVPYSGRLSMKRLVLAAFVSLQVTSAVAQPRPSTVAMSCHQAAGLVAASGGIVLGTGGYTYDRFVHHRGFCLRTEVTEAAWVQTRDTPQCFVGYRCRDPIGKRH